MMKKHILFAFVLFGLIYFFWTPGNIFGATTGKCFHLSCREGELFSKGEYPTQDLQKVRKGVFLVADPHLRDPNFVESVVLITDHGSEGTVGVIVNRESTTPLSRVFPDMKGFQGRDELLFIGGPVYPQGMSLLVRTTHPLEDSTLILRDVYFSSSLNTLARILELSDSEVVFRVFSGHAGWAPGQLEGELALGAWNILTARPEDIFDADPDALWGTLRNRTHQQYIEFREKPRFSNAGWKLE